MMHLNRHAPGGAQPSGQFTLSRPDYQPLVKEFMLDTARGDIPKAMSVWSRMFPSQAQRAINHHEAGMVEDRATAQRRLVRLMGEAMYDEAQLRKDSHLRQAAMALSRQDMDEYKRHSKETFADNMRDILGFFEEFVTCCQQAAGYPEDLREAAISRLHTILQAKLQAHEHKIQAFEASSRR